MDNVIFLLDDLYGAFGFKKFHYNGTPHRITDIFQAIDLHNKTRSGSYFFIFNTVNKNALSTS